MASFIFYVAWIASSQAIELSKHQPNYHANHEVRCNSNTSCVHFQLQLSNSSITFAERHTQDRDDWMTLPPNHIELYQMPANSTASNRTIYRTCTPAYGSCANRSQLSGVEDHKRLIGSRKTYFDLSVARCKSSLSSMPIVVETQNHVEKVIEPQRNTSQTSHVPLDKGNDEYVDGCNLPIVHSSSLFLSFSVSVEFTQGHNENRDEFNFTTHTPLNLWFLDYYSLTVPRHASLSIQNTQSRRVLTAHNNEPEYQVGYTFDLLPVSFGKAPNTTTVDTNYKNIYVASVIAIVFLLFMIFFSLKQVKRYGFVLLTTISLTLCGCSALNLVAGVSHTCAWSSYGTVKCFGKNDFGQLGLGDVVHRGRFSNQMGNHLPEVDLGRDFNVTQVSAWHVHTCALSTKFTVKCFGRNDQGQLGYGDVTDRGVSGNEMGINLPEVDLGTDFNVTRIAAGGGDFTCVLSTNFTVKCFGQNGYGQLGFGDGKSIGVSSNEMGNNLPEVDLGADFEVTQIVAGRWHVCDGSNGKLGYGDVAHRGRSSNSMGDNLTEVDLGTDFNVTQIVAGFDHTCALSSNNRVKCWGDNMDGRLGLGDTENRGDTGNSTGDNLPEVDLGTDFDVAQIVCGVAHTCVLSTRNRLKCYGSNQYGQLGYGDQNNRGSSSNEMGNNLPDVDLGTDFNVSKIILGGYHTCALSSSNTVKCFGFNYFGELGYGDTDLRGVSGNEMGNNLSLVDIGEGFATRHPTSAPSVAPTSTTTAPTYIPSFPPSANPVQPPTLQDIYCNDPAIVTEIDGEYSYFLHINAQSIVRFDTCDTLNLFDIFIVDINDMNKNYGCVECGSICYEPSQYQVTLSISQYRMDIHGPHAFKMICTPKSDTDAPTSFPITSEPTRTPSGYPTVTIPRTSISFPGDGVPISAYTFLSDPYGRFEASIQVVVRDAEGVLNLTPLCAECFIWQYRLRNAVWTDIDHATNDDISVYNKKIAVISTNQITTYQSSLTIQSIRRLNAGHCVDENDNSRLFKPGNIYELRLQLVIDREYFVPVTSGALSIETNSLPSGGFCAIQNVQYLEPLQSTNLFCDGWDNEDNLEYNAISKGILMSQNMFVDDARKLQSLAPVGNVSIVVMIKEVGMDNAVTCYTIRAEFKSISDIIDEQLNQNTSRNASSIVNGILKDIPSIINATSFADNQDVAVRIVTIIEDIYAKGLITQNDAARIVHDIVTNIIETSSGLDLVNELSAISSIISNEDLVDAETTTVLVNSYLPQIFEAIDVFVRVNANGTNNGLATYAKPSVIQGQLYAIARQSQEVIVSLESTLQAAWETDDETWTEQAVNEMNNLAQSLVNYTTLAASKALSQSNVGETFSYETIDYYEDGTIKNKKVLIATKFDANIIDFNDSTIEEDDIILPKCGTEHQNIELPLSFMRDQDGVFDCVFMASSRNSFISEQNRSQQSDTISINIYNIGSIPNEYESNSCFPYLITMQANDFNYDDDMSLGDAHTFPSCDFWNVTDSLWDTRGCFVYDVSAIDNTITCACIHLTSFSVSKDQLVPEANLLTEIDWREFTFHNLYHYPTVWLTCLLLLILFVFVCWVSPILCDKVKTSSIMAYEDIIYKSVQEDKLWADIVGKEIKYITDYMPNQHLLGRGLQTVAPTKEAKKSVCRLQWKLYGAYLRNDHTLLSVLQRTPGTNLSLSQRLGCFFMYLCNIMLVTGAFYGVEQHSTTKDVFASFIISLFSTLPVFMVRKVFEKSKPIQVISTKHILLDDDVKSPTRDGEEEEEEMAAITAVRASKAWKDWDMKAWMDETDDLTICVFNEQIEKLYDQDIYEQKIRATSDIRKVLFDTMFPLPHTFKKVGWIVLVIWSLGACITAIVYGFKFDIEARAIENTDYPNLWTYQNDDCWNNTLTLQIENSLSKQRFWTAYAQQQANNASGYGGSDAKSWLVSIFQSLLTSLLLWQPLTVYMVTWIKIWMFSWHLKMQIGPGNVVLLCKRCCCGYDHTLDHEDDDSNNKGLRSKLQMLSQHLSQSNNSKPAERRSSRKIRDVVAHKNRPVDIISFLGNEEWVIDDTCTSNGNGIGDTAGRQESDSVNERVGSNALEVELQVITNQDDEAKMQSDSTDNEGAGLTQTVGGKSSHDDVKDEDEDEDVDGLIAVVNEYIETME